MDEVHAEAAVPLRDEYLDAHVFFQGLYVAAHDVGLDGRLGVDLIHTQPEAT